MEVHKQNDTYMTINLEQLLKRFGHSNKIEKSFTKPCSISRHSIAKYVLKSRMRGEKVDLSPVNKVCPVAQWITPKQPKLSELSPLCAIHLGSITGCNYGLGGNRGNFITFSLQMIGYTLTYKNSEFTRLIFHYNKYNSQYRQLYIRPPPPPPPPHRGYSAACCTTYKYALHTLLMPFFVAIVYTYLGLGRTQLNSLSNKHNLACIGQLMKVDKHNLACIGQLIKVDYTILEPSSTTLLQLQLGDWLVVGNSNTSSTMQ